MQPAMTIEESTESANTPDAGEVWIKSKVMIIDPEALFSDEPPPELDESTGLPKVLKAYVVHEDPKISVCPHFVSDAEIDHILQLSEEHWIPSVVGTGVYKTNDEAKDLTNKPSKNRTSYSCMLRSAQTKTVKSLEYRIAQLAGMDVDHLERLNMVRYAPGQFFNEHHDGRFRPKTVFIYLNDLPEDDDGETYFPKLGLKFVPRKGCAILWSNVLEPNVEDMRMVHKGLPPRTAVKYGVNCFFNEKPLKQLEDPECFSGDDDADVPMAKKDGFHTVRVDDLMGQPAPQQLQPGQLRAFHVYQDPSLSIIPNLLSGDEVDALICIGKAVDVDHSAIERIETRIAAVTGLSVMQMDRIRVFRCDSDMIPSATPSDGYSEQYGVKTVAIFLNDVKDGGELRFPRLGFQVAPNQGTAVIWSAVNAAGEEDLRVVHQGRPPKVGVRYMAIAIFRAHEVRRLKAAASEI